MQDRLDEMKKENICTYYVLPLLKMNKGMLGESNFVDSYISEDRQYIYVHLLDVLSNHHRYSTHPDFEGVFKNLNFERFVRYKIPDYWLHDVGLICNGKFSQITSKAKKRIEVHSKLQFNIRQGNLEYTDIRLLALHRSPVLQEEMEKHWGMAHGFLDGQELLGIPEAKMFIKHEALFPDESVDVD